MSVVGIDLGTTNTVVGVVRDGQASALRDGDGEYLIPSVVSFHPTGTVLVGRPAKERRVVDAANTIYSIKRLIGRSWKSEEVEKARARFAFEMREGPGQAALVVARNETFTLPEISAFVLRHAKALAEKALGEPVDRAVITVPANFNDLQRAATKVAGRVAGLEVLRILNEPTAAALAYGYGRSRGERIAIYDFGGGTFDVTLLDLSGNVFEVLATAGNTFLGGDDIDLAIAERMADTCLAEHRIDARADPQIFERLRFYAERLKVDLSSASESTVDVPEVGRGPGGKPVRLSFSMRRTDLEALAAPIAERTFDVCRDALSIARLAPGDLDQIVLVGGSTRLPIVRRKVEEFFGRPPLDRINPDEVVAIGAAIQANALTGTERRRSVMPRPPMPAARNLEESVTAAVPRRSPDRKTDPFGSLGRAVKPPLPRPGGAGPARKRVTTGMGLGPAANAEARPLPLPEKRPPPPKKGGTLGGLAPPPAPRAARAPLLDGEGDLAAEATSSDALPTRPQQPVPEPPLYEAGPDDDEPTHVGAPHEMAALARASVPPVELSQVTELDDIGDFAAEGERLGAGRPTPGDAAKPAPLAFAATMLGPGTPKEPPPRPPDPEPLPSPGPSAGALEPWDPPPSSQRLSERPFMPAKAEVHRWAISDRPAAPPPMPLLVDVTPLGLCVETVGGFCDVLLERNTPVPCEQSRRFVTASDGQEMVRVRVGQGESARFAENTLLGEVELTGLRPAPRGAVQIVVAFALDTDGILEVRATDAETGKATAARLKLVGLPEAAELEKMAARHRSHPTS